MLESTPAARLILLVIVDQAMVVILIALEIKEYKYTYSNNIFSRHVLILIRRMRITALDLLHMDSFCNK